MTIEVFGIDADGVRTHYFPTFSAWVKPDSTAVGEMIDEAGAAVAGALAGESIATSELTAGTPEYVSCSAQVRRIAARRALEALTGSNPALAKRLDEQIDAWFKGLDEMGGTFLGNSDLGSLSASDADGPTMHLDEYVLAVSSDDVEPSDATNPFRKDDLL